MLRAGSFIQEAGSDSFIYIPEK